ncbi:fos-related antigen 2-like [Protopterus annectens]|uniref:fos-related antigen 2-like n=1 Tax=Protopterus annectens TaxID=7888 RepID=UPI001CFA9F61|nr:fos-related antigen 2-like [Protopterus annectens]
MLRGNYSVGRNGNYPSSSTGASTSSSFTLSPGTSISRGNGNTSRGSPSRSSVQQKYSGSSSAFVPTLNAITTSQDLQWMVQPTVIPTTSSSSQFSRPCSYSHLATASVNRLRCDIPSASTSFTVRRKQDEHLSPEEAERRRVRRERNKIAAAKCRNRRRELTEYLQSETEKLEDQKTNLQKEIAELKKQKDRLQLILEAHKPICKVPEDSDSDSDVPTFSIQPVISIKQEPSDEEGPSTSASIIPKSQKTVSRPVPTISINTTNIEQESLHTPTLITTPSVTPFTTSIVFAYPITPLCDTDITAAESPNQVSFGSKEPCSIAHRRSSSSGDLSSDSLNSPTLLAL